MSGTYLEQARIPDEVKASITAAFKEAGATILYGEMDGRSQKVMVVEQNGNTFDGMLSSHFTSDDFITCTGRVTELDVNGKNEIIHSEEPDLSPSSVTVFLTQKP